MRAHLSRRYRLSASHRLFCPEKTLEQNLALFGKCANPCGHGHNYVVQVTVSGTIDQATGMVIDLRELDARVHRDVIQVFDSTNLNLHACFHDLVPTTEHFCMEIHKRLVSGFGDARLERVRIEETANNSFEYAGGQERDTIWQVAQ